MTCRNLRSLLSDLRATQRKPFHFLSCIPGPEKRQRGKPITAEGKKKARTNTFLSSAAGNYHLFLISLLVLFFLRSNTESRLLRQSFSLFGFIDGNRATIQAKTGLGWAPKGTRRDREIEYISFTHHVCFFPSHFRAVVASARTGDQVVAIWSLPVLRTKRERELLDRRHCSPVCPAPPSYLTFFLFLLSLPFLDLVAVI